MRGFAGAVLSLVLMLACLGIAGIVVFVSRVNTGLEKTGLEKTGPEQAGGQLKTVQHEGHWFVLYDYTYRGGVVHHPDCPCLKKAEAAR